MFPRLVIEDGHRMHLALRGLLFLTVDPRIGKQREWVRHKPQRRRRLEALRLCGARTRKGTPCRALTVTGKQRCRLHGGLSTGPRTVEGRARIAESNRRRATCL